MSLFLGYEVADYDKAKKVVNTATVGSEVKIPIFHMLVTGQTQLSGKTTLLKTLARQVSEQDYKILVIDSKTNMEDYQGFGQDVPVCLRETTDALVLIRLIEAIFARKLTAYYATLTRVAEGAKTFDDVIHNCETVEAEAKSGFIADAAHALADLIQRLQEQATKVETSQDLQVPYAINRMSINAFGDESASAGQQLIVKTVMELALHIPKLIVIIDEAFKFLPQKYRSACHESVQKYVTQGAATGNYLWMSTQFLAPTSKDAMKTMAVKLLGTQDHITECKHTVDLIPYSKERKYSTDKIMSLKLGHFVVVTKQMLKTVYVVPEFADKDEAFQIAMGTRDPKDLHYILEVTEEEMKKIQPTLTAESNATAKPEKKTEKTDATIKVEVEPVIGATQETLPISEEDSPLKPSFTGKPTSGYGWNDRFERNETNIEALRQRILKLEHKFEGLTARTIDNTNNIDLKKTTTKIATTNVQKRVIIDTQNLSGRILFLAKEGFFSDWRRLSDVVNKLVEYKYTAPPTSVQGQLIDLAYSGILSLKKQNRKNYYALSPNVVFEENK